jgi:hypothetical protein
LASASNKNPNQKTAGRAFFSASASLKISV